MWRRASRTSAPPQAKRALRHPWSVLAYQLAGDEGLSAIHADGKAEERETPPAEPLLAKLLAIPGERGFGTLVLVDEVLMYAREKVGLDAKWQPRIVDFFQHLVAAVGKVDRAAMVASLLATDPKKQDAVGLRVRDELFAVVRRQREEGVQPVAREDVAEVLRRRFFEREGLQQEDAYKSHVIGVVRELAKLDETTAKDRSAQETRFLASFPFHPDLTDVFYGKWTQLPAFQRTRGILRTLATALRAARQWDASPLVGPAALLAAPGEAGVSEAVKDLANVVDTGSEGRPTDWARLLEGELAKAREIQDEFPALAPSRAAEQAIVATFLHSQPIGSKANTPELQRAVGSGADGIELMKALRRWREVSWFLDDEDARGVGEQELPKSWRLGNRPNLKQMHDEACRERVTSDAVDAALADAIRKARNSLTGGAAATGAKVHLLPASPADVQDDDLFRFVILGPDAVSDSGRPSALAKRYLAETTGPKRPRVNRNALVLAVPSRDGLDAMRASARTLLGWEDVSAQLQDQTVDPLRAERLRRELQEARTRLPQMVRQGYAVVVSVGEDGEAQAFRLAAAAGPLFIEIKNDERARIKETAIDAEALLPGGPFDLWRDDEDARFVKDLANAFTRDPRLPKVLNAGVVHDTVLQGVERGLLVRSACAAGRQRAHLVADARGPGSAPGTDIGSGAAAAGRSFGPPARVAAAGGAAGPLAGRPPNPQAGQGLLQRQPRRHDCPRRLGGAGADSALLRSNLETGVGGGRAAGRRVAGERPDFLLEGGRNHRGPRRAGGTAAAAGTDRASGPHAFEPPRGLGGRREPAAQPSSGRCPSSAAWHCLGVWCATASEKRCEAAGFRPFAAATPSPSSTPPARGACARPMPSVRQRRRHKRQLWSWKRTRCRTWRSGFRNCSKRALATACAFAWALPSMRVRRRPFARRWTSCSIRLSPT